MLEQILLNPFFFRSLIAVLLISVITGVLGSFTIFRGITFVTATLAHVVWLGAALGIFIKIYFWDFIDPLFIAIIVTVCSATAISFLAGEDVGEKFDVAIGIVFALSMSLAILITSMLREYTQVVVSIIFGDILLLSQKDLVYLIAITATIIIVTITLLNQFIYISFDAEGAKASGLNVPLYQTIMLLLIGIAIVVMVKSVGAILVYAILTIPPATANEVARNVYEAMILSFIFSLVSGIFGLISAIYINVAPSALMGLIATTIYIIVKIYSAKIK